MKVTIEPTQPDEFETDGTGALLLLDKLEKAFLQVARQLLMKSAQRNLQWGEVEAIEQLGDSLAKSYEKRIGQLKAQIRKRLADDNL